MLPAALLSVALSAPWGGAAAPTAEPEATPTDDTPPTTVPTESIEAPANVARRGAAVARDRRALEGDVAKATAAGIPSGALAAYQRAQTVINAADKSCKLDWQLIAAIGRVESDHGRYGGNTLDKKGVSQPGIYGIPLDGSNNTSVIRDTDAGQYDDDQKWDRAVGPMQFIPSTWSVVGVDGDNDGERNPQDIDDAALATAVYLCSGNDDLSTERGRRAAIFRYNHSHQYVDLVLGFMDAYLEGDFTSLPSLASGTTSFTGAFDRPSVAVPTRAEQRAAARAESLRYEQGEQSPDAEVVTPGGKPSQGPDHDSEVITPPKPGGEEPTDPGAEEPSDPVTEEPTNPGTEEPADPGTEEPTTPGSGQPTDPGTEEPSAPPTPDQPEATPPTEEQATTQCLTEVGATAEQLPDLEALGLLVDFDTCMAGLGFPQ